MTDHKTTTQTDPLEIEKIIRRAHQLRAENTANMARQASAWVKSLFSRPATLGTSAH